MKTLQVLTGVVCAVAIATIGACIGYIAVAKADSKDNQQVEVQRVVRTQTQTQMQKVQTLGFTGRYTLIRLNGKLTIVDSLAFVDSNTTFKCDAKRKGSLDTNLSIKITIKSLTFVLWRIDV